MAHALARVGQEPRPSDVVVALIALMALAAVVMAANDMRWGDTRSTLTASYWIVRGLNVETGLPRHPRPLPSQ